MVKAILRKKKRGGEINSPRLHFKAIVIKTVQYQDKTDIDHGNSIESPEINPQTYRQSLTAEKNPGSSIGVARKTRKIYVKE